MLIVGGGFLGRSLLDVFDHKASAVLVSNHGALALADQSNAKIVSRCEELDPKHPWDKVIYCSGPSVPASVTLSEAAQYTRNFDTVLDFCRNARCFVYVSSGGAFYKSASGRHAEIDLVDFDSPYSRLHYLNEVSLSRCRSINSRAVFRLGNPFGKNQDPSRSVGFVTQTVKAALSGRKLQIFGDGNIRRDFFHVSSFAEFVMSPMLADIVGYEIYNFGSGVSRSLFDVIDSVQRVFGSKIDYEIIPSLGGARSVVELDTTKLKNAFPGLSVLGLDEGLRKF